MKYPKDSERIKEVCEYLHITPYTLAKNIGYKSVSSVYHVEKGENKLTTQMASKIVDAYPQFSFLYLIGEAGKDDSLIATKDVFFLQENLKMAQSDGKKYSKEYIELKQDMLKLQYELSLLQLEMQKVIKLVLKE